MKIVVLDGYTLNPGDLGWDSICRLGSLTVYDRTAPSEVLSRIGNATAVFTNKVLLTEEHMQACPALKYIGVMATGFNVVDLDAANRAGIVVTNIPAYSTDSVAQLTFSFILDFANRVSLHAENVKAGAWSSSIDFSFSLSAQTEIAGKTIGIVGMGKIGQKIASIAQAFGMRVIFANRSDKSNLNPGWEQVELDALLQQSDYVSLNCPLTEANKGFLNKDKIALMKKSAFLINTGRGPLINEQDLADALNRGDLAGAGLDVLSIEPPRKDNPLLSATNCIVTPHIAWATLEARGRLMKILGENFEAYLNNKPQNVVNNPF